MCTSFSIYSNEILYGMNFDISSRPIKFSLVNKKDNKALLILQKKNGTFYPSFGFTENGVFANLLMVEPTEKGKYRRGKNIVHIMKIFDEVISNKVAVEDIKEKYKQFSIVNVPSFSVHSMIANMNITVFIEPGEEIISEDRTSKKYFVLSNGSIADSQKEADNRYCTCSLGLEKYEQNISVEKGFEILKSCCQKDGEYPTQLSMISRPREGEIYFVAQRDFDKVYKYSFKTDIITLWKGEGQREDILLKKELLLEALETVSKDK